MSRWRRGPGRWAGTLAMVLGSFLFLWLLANENILLGNCTNPDDQNQCLGDATVNSNAVWAVGLFAFGFLLATAAANVTQWRRLKAHRSQVAPRLARLRLAPTADPEAIQGIEHALTDRTSEPAQAAAARDNFLAWALLLGPAVFAEMFWTYHYHVLTGGTIETSYDIALLRFHFATTLITTAFAAIALRATVRLHRGARSLREQAEKKLLALEQEAALTKGEAPARPAASFRPWGARPAPKN